MLISIVIKLFSNYYILSNQKIVLFDKNPNGKSDITTRVIKTRLNLIRIKDIKDRDYYNLNYK